MQHSALVLVNIQNLLPLVTHDALGRFRLQQPRAQDLACVLELECLQISEYQPQGQV